MRADLDAKLRRISDAELEALLYAVAAEELRRHHARRRHEEVPPCGDA